MALIDSSFSSFTPDLPTLNNPGYVRVHNCTAGLGSTQGAITLFPLKSAALFSNTAMESQPLGSAVGQDRFGNARVYAGSAAALYKLSPVDRQWTDISRSGAYTTAVTERWKNVEFGSLQVFTNYNDEIQFIDMNDDIEFANLTTLVKARHIATHKGFIVVGNTYDSLDGAVPYRVRWSAIENPADWSFSPATQADFQDIHGYGSVQGIVTDDSCYVLLQRGIVQMTYIGAPYVFQFTDRVTGKGCSVPESVVTVEGRHFFISDDGFYQLFGGQLSPIGMGKIDKWFLETADLTQHTLMTTACDPRNTLVYWQFVSKSSATGKPDMMLIYNYATGEWSTADASTHFIFNSMSLPWTIDQLDEFGAIDDVPASFDDPIWAGGQQMLWGMNLSGKIYSFGGPTLELTVETPDFQLSRMIDQSAEMAIVNAARPLFEGDGIARVRVGTKARTNDDLTWSQLTEQNDETGFAYMRAMGRYQRFRVRLSGEWSKAYGIQIDVQAAGKR